jgi:hypothetical protein
MNAQRFINLAPKFFSFDDRYEIVSKLYEKTKQRNEVHHLTAILGINENAMHQMEGLFERLCKKPLEHKWPDQVLKFVGWICDNDSIAAKSLQTGIEAEKSILIVQAARHECARLMQCIKSLDSAIGTHRVDLPYGTISLHVRKPTFIEKIKQIFG